MLILWISFIDEDILLFFTISRQHKKLCWEILKSNDGFMLKTCMIWSVLTISNDLIYHFRPKPECKNSTQPRQKVRHIDAFQKKYSLKCALNCSLPYSKGGGTPVCTLLPWLLINRLYDGSVEALQVYFFLLWLQEKNIMIYMPRYDFDSLSNFEKSHFQIAP